MILRKEREIEASSGVARATDMNEVNAHDVGPDWGNTGAAWDRFQESQAWDEHVIGMVTQPAHAVLSGQLAGFLLPAFFGTVPAEIVEIIAAHDRGWAKADLRALECAESERPVSFLSVSPGEAVAAWRESIQLAEQASITAAVLTSRHFCLVATPDKAAHRSFVEEERRRMERLGQQLAISQHEVIAFTSVLGFCDLLSLYLCAGCQGRAWLPLDHPADRKACYADRVLITTSGNVARFKPHVFMPGSHVRVASWKMLEDFSLNGSSIEWDLY